MKDISDLGVKLFADRADLADMPALCRRPYIGGFTTNPTLMHRAGVADDRQFAREVLAAIPDRPISFEVFSANISCLPVASPTPAAIRCRS
jgi:transaldolase